MAYVPDNFQCKGYNGPNAGTRIWTLSGVDAIATVRGAGFISDGLVKGAKVGDIVIYADTATPLVSLSRVSVVASTGLTMTA